MQIGVPKETKSGECRVAGTPDAAKKLLKKGFIVAVEKGAGALAGFSDQDYETAGVKLVESAAEVFKSQVVFKVHRPSDEEISLLQKNGVLISFLEPFRKDDHFSKLAQAEVSAFSMELIPRTTRAQSMDALSSQANIAGFRAVLEAANRYGRFFPMMMTSAGMSKPARVLVLGAGVAGLQAIATAKRLGAVVEAFDVRSEVKEQILSLGAKFVELDIGEEGTGSGGYAKELSEEGKRKQIEALGEKIKKSDIVISTANIPGRKAPILISESAVKGMRTGSVIVDMAAANGGNCPLTVPEQIVQKFGVTLIGITNFPSLMATDASQFYSNNLINLLTIMTEEKNGKPELKIDLNDDILAASLTTYEKQVRLKT
jgi:NAD(P) transhydrogenase subunit alpha